MYLPGAEIKRKVIIMKTRKVGKLVSLILAIVLVATIMIPAVNVLAQPSGTTAADYTGTWTKVGSFDELNDAIEAANNAPDGSADKTIHLILTGNITCETPYVYGQDSGKPDYSMMYIQSRTKLSSEYKILEKNWKDDPFGPGHWSTATCQGTNGKGIVRDTEWLISQAGSPYNVKDTSSPFYGMTEADFENGFVVTKAMQEAVGMGSKANAIQDVGAAYDEKIGNEYDEKMLIIEKNTNVVIDLNGKTISAGGKDVYTSAPNKQMSVFIVRGTLTIADLSNKKDSNGNPIVGQLIGGTGNVYFAEQTTNEMSTVRRVAVFNQDWSQVDLNGKAYLWTFRDGYYRTWFESNSVYVKNATESRGGGVYVENGGTFNLESGKITGNCAYMDAGKTIFASGADAVTKGGGVFVEAGGTFNMTGGEISNNASRAYQTNTSAAAAAKDAYAYGGGVYLEGTQGTVEGAVMTMTGGKIAENALYAEVGSNGSSARSARAYGGGIYVGIGATCTIMGDDVEEGKTDLEMVKSFPQVTNNSIGALAKYSSATNPDITIQGGGIYNGGTLNLKNALITANDFAEGDVDIPGPGNKKSALGLNTATRIMRDPETGLASYILEYNADGTAKTCVTRLDDRFSENLELATEKVPHATTGVYGTMHGNEEMVIFSDGAGVCVRENAKLVVGERVWITDNYDLVTTGHKAFTSVRDYTRTWEQEKQITDDRVMTTNDNGYGVSYTDPAGGYVYDGTYVAPDTNATMADGTPYTSHVMDGYAFSDTTDDVYLPEGNVIYKGGSLFETKIGVNYWNMVNADGEVKPDGYGQAGNRVIVKAGKNLDPEIWGTDSSIPTQSDIQFFYLNDNNKNWERVGSRTRNANNDYYDYPKTDKNVPVYGYKLPSYLTPDYVLAGVSYPATLCDKNIDSAVNWGSRVRITAIDADSTAVNRYASPYEGYINYDKTYAAGRWQYGISGASGALDEDNQPGYWKTYDKATYRISDPDWSPDQSAYRPKTGGVLSNAIVNFPQRAYPVTSTMKSGLDNLANGGLPESYLKAKYMDYKVVYDNDQFGKTEPVLRFGTYEDAQSNYTIRKMFVTVNFDEAGTHYYGQSKDTVVFSKDTAGTSANTDSFVTNDTAFSDVAAESTFYGANKTKGTINIAKIVPNYAAYGKSDELTARGTEKIETEDGKLTRPLTSISKTGGIEQTDLYFKGWRYYTSYGDGPETVTLDNSVAETSLGDSLTYRGYYPIKLENLFNPNINSQPCPSLTATWYTREELEDARARVSNVMVQNVIRSDNKVAVRAIAMVGSGYYGYDHAGFVMSTKNATPTVEGGYDFVTRANVYKKIGVTIDGEKQWYDSDVLLGKNYYDMSTNPTYKGSPIYNAQWTFTDDSHKAAFINRLETKNDGYVYAGIIYVDIIVGTYDPDAEGDTLSDKITWDKNADGSLKKDTVYYVTPYAIEDNATSYYYGQSRAICYADGI